MQGEQPGQEQPAEQRREDADGQQEGGLGRWFAITALQSKVSTIDLAFGTAHDALTLLVFVAAGRERVLNVLTKLAADLVSAFVSNNSVRAEDVAGLLRDVHSKLAELATGRTATPAEVKLQPPMPIKKTITPGYLISLEDCRHYKTLRRHLAKRGLTPDEYRAKWGLPADYPMVAKDYAERRSALAKSFGLGRKSAPSDPVQAIANDLIDVIAEDVIGEEAGVAEAVPAEVAEALSPTRAGRPAKAERKITPHPKPKQRASAKRATTPVEDADVVA